ncbi:MAG: ABC transporter ATP-binding protein [Balneolaceae bacterium]|nr:ABC transporter ATP-binding protein [Balneolaceae bacterium]
MSIPAVSIQNLSKSYRIGFSIHKFKAVDGLSCEVPQGMVMGLIGPNGAGKTTTIHCLLGMLMPDEGSVSLFGEDPCNPEVRRRLGYQSEIFHTYDFLKPQAALRFYGRLAGLPENGLEGRIEEELERMGLSNAREKKVKHFSKGMRQRLGVAQALMHDPDLLILDEPFTGLDPQGRKVIGDRVLQEKQAGKTVFFSSHNLTDIERLCDHVIMIREGQVVMSGDIHELTASEDRWKIEVEGWQESYAGRLGGEGVSVRQELDLHVIECDGGRKEEVIRTLLDLQVNILRLNPSTRSLEERYMELESSESKAEEEEEAAQS